MSENIDKWFQQGNEFLANGKYDEAIRCYGEAIKINPKHAVALSNKALAP